MDTDKQALSRISVSLPSSLLEDFDKMIEQRQCTNRSQALVDLIHKELNVHFTDEGEKIMAGTINVVYEHNIANLQKQLSEIQHRYLDEVISTLNVNLTDSQTLSVILVQGPARKLKRISDEIISLRGVLTGRMMLSAAILPPVHPFPPILD